MTPEDSPTIHLVADDTRSRRYPDRLWVRNALLEVEPETAGRRPVATVIDRDASLLSAQVDLPVPVDGPVMVSLDVLATYLQECGSDLPAQEWLALLPADVSADLDAAQHHVASGAIGSPQVVDITVPVGIPSAGDWNVDHIGALSDVEALVFGMRVAERVTDAIVETSRWLPGRASRHTLVHQLDNGVQVVHHIIAATNSPTTAFEGVVLGESGRMALRQPFAPGSVGLWRTDQPGYTFPAIYEAKDDVQAPDSATGGWEMTALLRDLVAPGQRAARQRDHAIRLVGHAVQLLPGGNDDH